MSTSIAIPGEKKAQGSSIHMLNMLNVCLFLFVVSLCEAQKAQIRISTPNLSVSPLVQFGVREVHSALYHIKWEVCEEANCTWEIVVSTSKYNDNNNTPYGMSHPQGYIIFSTGNTVYVIGGTPIGVMYGLLRLGEHIGHSKGHLADLSLSVKIPLLEKRGIKLNVPLDARTPSYGDMGDSAQRNIVTMWDLSFWHEYLDQLARYQYNLLTLWSDNPWPSMLQYPSPYDDLSLDDVKQVHGISTRDLYLNHYLNGQTHQVDMEILNSSKTVLHMNSAQKVQFWQKVFSHAQSRGIEIMILTWNIWVWPIQDTNPQNSIDSSQNNTHTIDFIKSSLLLALATYPQIVGIGISPGEHMVDEQGQFSKANWSWAAYGSAIAAQQGKTQFILRTTDATGNVTSYLSVFQPLINQQVFSIDFKYSNARMYSSTTPVFAQKFVKFLEENKLKTFWNVRNDDLFNFLWGDPNYAREYLLNMPLSVTNGFYMGSDGYVWGRTYANVNGTSQLEINKHWFNFMIWGRLSFDPTLDRAFWINSLKFQFPELSDSLASTLLNAFTNVSKIIPQLNRFFFKRNDFEFLPEGCSNTTNGRYYYTVLDFVVHQPMDGQNVIKIPDYVKDVLAGKHIEGVTPVQVSQNLSMAANLATSNVNILRRTPVSRALDNVLTDIVSQSCLGAYYASKIAAALEVQFFLDTNQESNRTAALDHLRDGLKAWTNLVSNATSLYINPQVMSRVGILDWEAGLVDAEGDISLVKNL